MPSPGEPEENADLSPLARRLAARRKMGRVTDVARQDRAVPPDPDTSSVAGGIGLTLGLHVLALAAAIGVDVLFMRFGINKSYYPYVSPLFLSLMGVTQLVYIVPVTLVAFHRGRGKRAKGLIIGASATFLLYGLCWSAVFL